jgi:hypothetical protein
MSVRASPKETKLARSAWTTVVGVKLIPGFERGRLPGASDKSYRVSTSARR